MPAVLKNSIKTLPSLDDAGRTGGVTVRVVPMTVRLAYQWHRHVQPLVNQHYVGAIGAGPNEKTRADVGWNWVTLLYLAAAHDLMSYLPGNASGRSKALSIVVDTGGTGDFPIGMLTCVPRLFTHAFGVGRQRAFAWHLADAPSEVYSMVLGRPFVKGVALALLDCAIQAGLDQQGDGTFLLHADPNGGQRLKEFYRYKCGLDQLPAGSGPITRIFRRRRSEEYFHFDELQAKGFCAKFHHQR